MGGTGSSFDAARAETRTRLGLGAATLVALLTAWVVASATGVLDPARFPAPGDVWQAAVQLATKGYAGGTLWLQVWHSSWLVLTGFVVAAATGVPLGLLMGVSRRAEALINPTFLLIRPIPPLAWIPLAILWFGLGDGGKVFVIWFAAFVPAVINAYTGVRTIDPTLLAAARVHGAGSRRLLLDVIWPAALPHVFTGLRLSLQASWTTVVAAELVGAFFGLGRVLIIAAQDIYPGMIAFAMAWVALMGALMSWALARLERRAVPWRAA
jgi:NitT/TauT family transport system permease protein/taurine transport system permease protein